ncbi:MAG: TolC family protein [Burkholderiales bacterium]|nr:TolC family protein [Burkholderiales bacterium]MBI3730391.1 TolC family protein [Burkholderiales bacterium]
MLLPLNVVVVLLCPLLAQAQKPSADQPVFYPIRVPATAMSAAPAIPAVFNLPTALAYALASNPDIAAARREIQASEGALRQAGIIPNPELSAVMEDARQNTRSTTVQINQALELGGKRGARISVAERSRAAAMNELAIKSAEIRAAVTTNFYAVLIAQERQRLATTSLELAQRASHAASRQVTLGKIPPLEAARAGIAESGVRVELAQANSELLTAKHRLAVALGGGLSADQQLQGEFNTLPILPAIQKLTQGLSQSPLIQRARIELDKRMAMSELEKSRQIPDLTLSIGAKREQQTGRNQAIAGISIPLSLFDRNQGNLQEALSRTDKARDELTGTENRLYSEVLQAHQRLSLARDEAELLQKEVLPVAQNAFDIAIKGFEYGKFNFMDVLDAQRSLLQTKAQYLRGLSEAQRAAADIEAYMGDREFSLFTATSSF